LFITFGGTGSCDLLVFQGIACELGSLIEAYLHPHLRPAPHPRHPRNKKAA
jgi:hypothetical protein